MSMTTMNLIRILGTGLLATTVACAAGKPATKEEQAEQASRAQAPPDITKDAGKPKIERKVSKEASTDFKAAVAFYNQKSADGWTNDECNAAAAKFEQVGNEHDKLPEAWFNAGRAYQNCKMTKEAEGAYQKANKAAGGQHAPSLVNLGEIYFRGGNDKVGEQYFEQALKADGTIAAGYANKAWIYYDRMRKASTDAEKAKWEKEALFNLKNALAVDNDDVTARVLMAMVYMEGSDKNKNRLDIALMLLDGVAKNKPTLKDKATDEEKVQFERDMLRYEQNTRFPLLYNALGLVYMKRGNVGRALGYFRQAVQLDGDFVEARLNLGFTVLGFRKYEEAAEHFGVVVKLQPKNYDARIGLGVALRGQRKIDEAEQAYKQAVEIDGTQGAAYYNLGVLWKDFRTNDPDQKKNRDAYRTAKNYYNQYLSKSDAKGDKRKDAEESVKDCDEAIATLDQVIQQLESAPPAAAPPAAPAEEKKPG